MRRKLNISHRQAGFTLAEVVIASALLIVAIVPILRALTSAQATNTIIERRTHSLMLAQAKLEDIKARSVYSYGDVFAEANSSISGLYLCNVSDSALSADLRQITVSVGSDLSGDSILDAGEIEVTLSTLLARRW